MAKEQQIYGLDLMRFFAAVVVVMSHLGLTAFYNPTSFINGAMGLGLYLPDWWPITNWGWIGVQIFFVISGIVIAGSAERSSSALDFAKRRFIRLFPAMLITMLICVVIALAVFQHPPGQVLMEFARSVTFFPYGPWLSVAIWTLPIEIVFYALVAVLLLLRQTRHLVLLAYAIGIISAVNWLVLYPLDLSSNARKLQLLLIPHGIYFAIGMLFHAMHSKGFSWLRMAAVVLFCAAAWNQITFMNLFETRDYPFAVSTVPVYLIWLGSTALLWLSLQCAGPVAAWVERRNLGRTLRIMGLATYPLYLVHIHVAGAVQTSFIRAGGSPGLALILGIVAAVAVAVLVVIWAEPVLQRALKALLFARQPGRQPSAAA